MRADARVMLLILLAIWAGIVIGVSLIATPVKFQAPSLTMRTGLEIGRYTFRLYWRVELVLLIATVAAAAFTRPGRITWTMLALIVVMIVLQRFWLLPFLDQRVSEVLAGGAPAFSVHHRIYAAMEILKAALLIAGAAVEQAAQLR